MRLAVSPAEPTQDRTTKTDADAADNKTEPSRQRMLEWVLLGLFVAAGLITLVCCLLIAVSLALLVWLPAILLVGVLVVAAWRWS